MFDMLGNILRNVVSKPATRIYPLNKRKPFPKARGKVSINIENCIFCGICGRKCPSEAISINKAEKSWEVDPFKCIICGLCEEVCPKKCIYMEGEYKTPAYSKENEKHFQQVKNAKNATQESA